MEEWGARILLALITAVLTVGLAFILRRVSARMRQNPNRTKGHPERLRMPRFMLWTGIFILVIMGLLLLVAFTREDSEVAMKVIPYLIGLGGVFLIAQYVNWYLVVREDHLVFRNVFGQVRTIWYRDIVDHRFSNGALTVTTEDGTKFRVAPQSYDVTPLLKSL
ncbi:MAG: hypothetical protein Q4G64_00950 [bacterium]|nr:hypothetical protein [bacterium]